MLLAQAKAEGIVHNLIEEIPQSSTCEPVKKRLFEGFSPVVTTMHASTRNNSRPQAANKEYQKLGLHTYDTKQNEKHPCTERFTDLVVQVTGMYPAAVTCQMTIPLFIRHLFNEGFKIN